MASKQLRLCKLEGADHAGVFDGDEQLGHVTHSDIQAYHEAHIEPDADDKAKASAAGAVREPPLQLTDVGARNGENVDEIKRLVELGRETEKDRGRTAGRTVLLAECVRSSPESGPEASGRGPGSILDGEKAKVLLRAGKISAEDFIDAHDTAEFIEQAVQDGRVLPRDRAAAFKIALTSVEYRDFLKTAPRVVLLGSVGLGTGTAISVDDEVSAKVKEAQKADPKLTFSEAFTQALSSDTALAQRYHQAHRREVGSGAQASVA